VQNGLLRQAVLLFKEVFSMATTRLMPLHTGKGRTVGQAISDIIDYTENPQKTDRQADYELAMRQQDCRRSE